jgi:uncharacterized protein YqgV (UPF0045/DUF77 family)
MQAAIEISMYPLKDDYIAPIDAVIEKLNSFDGLRIETFATATTLIGDYGLAMVAIKETIAWSYDKFGSAVFVTKIIPGYEP